MRPRSFIAPLLVVLSWQSASLLGWLPSNLLPSPWAILQGLYYLAAEGIPPGSLLHNHILFSLKSVIAGFAVAATLGIPLGLFMGWSPLLKELLGPIIEVLRPIPPLAWIPISILWFGIGMKSAAFIIFLGAFFPIVLNTISGVLSINPTLIEAAKTLSAGSKDIFFKVLLPGSMPSVFVGMRIGMGIGWMTLVAAEFTGVREGYGLGYMIMTARDIQRPDQILAGMAVIGIVGLVINQVLKGFEDRALRWR